MTGDDLDEARGATTEAPIHDFAAKLTRPAAWGHVRAYVEWQAARRDAAERGESLHAIETAVPALSPLSINLDLTTACNFRCDHCVDLDILNQKARHDDGLLDALTCMAEHGLRSVILIGGGEPTLHRDFVEVVRRLKGLGLQVGIVTNGSNMGRVLEVADVLDVPDFVRLSLDSGTDRTFQAMHRPRRPITLDEICAGVRPIKAANPRVQVGFSFIITWSGCEANDTTIHQNIDEMVSATALAKESGFDYISFKPFLERGSLGVAATEGRTSGPEIVRLLEEERLLASVLTQIRQNLEQAHRLADESFRVIESTNLRVFENGTYGDYTRQPARCHMTFFRQVLSPLGTFNCPVYRDVAHARVGDRDAFKDPTSVASTSRRALQLIDRFDASVECRSVTCLYNSANWFLERLIDEPALLDSIPAAEDGDLFL